MARQRGRELVVRHQTMSPLGKGMTETNGRMTGTDKWVGRVVGNYHLLRQLGQGGMGCVYEAVHTLLDRRVAVKLIRPDTPFASSADERFYREAQILNALRSPHIVGMIDFGKDGELPYLVMEYAEGLNLREVLLEGPLHAPEALDVAIQACLGLEVSHAQGIIHRDLKPENLILSQDAKGARLVRILDFGVATCRSLLPRVEGSLFETQEGTALGSPHYMAPEQVRDAKQVDVRADVYALGVTLFEMIAAERPFEGSSREEILVAKLFLAQPELDGAQLQLPEALVRCVSRAMARAPEDRFGSIREMRGVLERCQSTLTTCTYPKPPPRSKPAADCRPTLSTPDSFVNRNAVAAPKLADPNAETEPEPMPECARQDNLWLPTPLHSIPRAGLVRSEPQEVPWRFTGLQTWLFGFALLGMVAVVWAYSAFGTTITVIERAPRPELITHDPPVQVPAVTHPSSSPMNPSQVPSAPAPSASVALIERSPVPTTSKVAQAPKSAASRPPIRPVPSATRDDHTNRAAPSEPMPLDEPVPAGPSADERDLPTPPNYKRDEN